jgi:H3 lysine-79-specific histone-lysine N-methyltransferase
MKQRWKMWALKGNEECKAIEGDFCADPDVVKALQKADLVVSTRVEEVLGNDRKADCMYAMTVPLASQLVNNYAFTPALNDRLSLLFLELKDETRIISLKPFLPDKFRLNDRNVSHLGKSPC